MAVATLVVGLTARPIMHSLSPTQHLSLTWRSWLVASDFDEPSSNTKLKRVSVCLVSDTRKYTGWAEVSDAANPREVLSL